MQQQVLLHGVVVEVEGQRRGDGDGWGVGVVGQKRVFSSC